MFTLDVVVTEFAALVVNFQIRQLFQAFQLFLYDVKRQSLNSSGFAVGLKRLWWNREARSSVLLRRPNPSILNLLAAIIHDRRCKRTIYITPSIYPITSVIS